jgi:hypothetical protein
MNNQANSSIYFLHGDAFGKVISQSLTLIVSLLLLFISLSAHAQVDFSVSTYARTLPRSASLDLELGLGYPYWGSPGGDSIMYGYFRPFAIGSNSGAHNELTYGLDFFPISFLGLRTAAVYMNNYLDYQEFDCQKYNCTGTRYKAYAEGVVAIGNKQVFGKVRMRSEKWSQAHELAGDFIDPASGLAIKANGDSESVWNVYFGMTIQDKYKVLIGNRYAQVANIRGISQFTYIGGMYNWAPVDLGIGVTTFKSSLKERGTGIFFTATWEIKPSVALH